MGGEQAPPSPVSGVDTPRFPWEPRIFIIAGLVIVVVCLVILVVCVVIVAVVVVVKQRAELQSRLELALAIAERLVHDRDEIQMSTAVDLPRLPSGLPSALCDASFLPK